MLAIFDVEGVLYDAEYLPILAEKVNKENKIWEITKKGLEGKINWEFVDCPVLKKEVQFIPCFVCPNFQSRVTGKVLCKGDEL